MPDRSAAFAPGRVNIIGEHTDYNDGLALPFAIAAGVTVRAARRKEAGAGPATVRASALDLDEVDEFSLSAPQPAEGWRSYVRGVVAELQGAGVSLAPVSLEIDSNLAPGAGLSSSAALTVALSVALLGLAGEREEEWPDRLALAQLCARVERDWAGADTGLLDELASLYGAARLALRIDFASLAIEQVPLALDGWRFVVCDSGERHELASSGYNERRGECRRACELMGISSLREADRERAARLPDPLPDRVAHVLGENERVELAAAALRDGDRVELARLIDASHRSLRDLYDVSTPAVEQAVGRLLDEGAAGARIMGGGFGGSVLGLLPRGVELPAAAIEVAPGRGAHLLDS